MAVKLRLSSQNIEDLAMIAELGGDSITALSEHLKNVDPVPLRPRELVNEISKSLGIDEEKADTIAQNIVLYRGMMSQMDLNAAELFDAISSTFKLETNQDDTEIAKLKEIGSALQELLGVKAVKLVTATIDLSYEYANLLRSARIITDIRPIFDESAAEIDGAVISHTLRLRYDSTEGDHEMLFALDASDIEDLSYQCERAIAKAQTAHKLMTEKAEILTSISGDDGNVD